MAPGPLVDHGYRIDPAQIPAVVAVGHAFVAGDVPGVVALTHPTGDAPDARVAMSVAALDQLTRLEVHGPHFAFPACGQTSRGCAKPPSPDSAGCASIGDQQLRWQMNRKRLLVGGLLTLAIVIASTSVSWSRPVVPDGATRGTDPPSTSGIAGPAGPQQISPVAAYFKRVTYQGYQLRPIPGRPAFGCPPAAIWSRWCHPGSVDAVGLPGRLVPARPPARRQPAPTPVTSPSRNPATTAEVSCFQEPPEPDRDCQLRALLLPRRLTTG